MSNKNVNDATEQEQNSAKLVMKTFYKMANENGVTGVEIANYLRDKFGDVWNMTMLTGKAEETLKRSAQLGFLDQRGERYVSKLARALCCRRKCRRRRRCSRRRRRRGCRRRRRRRRPCSCG